MKLIQASYLQIVEPVLSLINVNRVRDHVAFIQDVNWIRNEISHLQTNRQIGKKINCSEKKINKTESMQDTQNNTVNYAIA